ncbi:hypothetical protein NECAME_16839 [Necator americanus]|uniref:Uncharacterized protein n=1 Tax=Necator americanus TaxID=51031 RepID=W2TT84_NECAM|nr:hypothetical protein NECAME_16839 [Necator americanus]ETN85275.1 hypothetical protein NECAME_16839 [Necator americanus]
MIPIEFLIPAWLYLDRMKQSSMVNDQIMDFFDETMGPNRERYGTVEDRISICIMRLGEPNGDHVQFTYEAEPNSYVRCACDSPWHQFRRSPRGSILPSIRLFV